MNKCEKPILPIIFIAQNFSLNLIRKITATWEGIDCFNKGKFYPVRIHRYFTLKMKNPPKSHKVHTKSLKLQNMASELNAKQTNIGLKLRQKSEIKGSSRRNSIALLNQLLPKQNTVAI